MQLRWSIPMRIVVETEAFVDSSYIPKPGDIFQVGSIYDDERKGWGYGYWDLEVIDVPTDGKAE
jgi:hypothetical protein